VTLGSDPQREHREWLLSLIPLREPLTLVDLGCGAGADLGVLAGRCSDPRTRLIGIDASPRAVDEAQAVTARDSRVSFICEHLGEGLPFVDSALDAVYSNNLIECLHDPVAFAGEVARVLRPGGTVVAAHWDWDTQLFDGGDRALVRRLVQAFADDQQEWMENVDPWMGRRLRGVFEQRGLFGGRVEAHTLIETRFVRGAYGYDRAQDFAALAAGAAVSEDDCRRFLAQQEELEAAGRYVYAVTEFAYVGRRAV
jgi:SAM-dependent methyltransferase